MPTSGACASQVTQPPAPAEPELHGQRRRDLEQWAQSALPARRFGQPEDIAHAITFLLTKTYVTAHTLVVDGGFVGS